VPNIGSQGLIWDFAAFGGSPPAGSLDGSAAAVLDRLTRIRLDRATRPITGVQRRRDSGTTASTCCAPPPGRRAPAVVGGPGDPLRPHATPAPTPPMPAIRHTANAPAPARRPGEATRDLPQARAGTATDAPYHPRPGAAPGRRKSWLWLSAHRRADRGPGPEGVPSHRVGNL
jgi:hypothetical protein